MLVILKNLASFEFCEEWTGFLILLLTVTDLTIYIFQISSLVLTFSDAFRELHKQIGSSGRIYLEIICDNVSPGLFEVLIAFILEQFKLRGKGKISRLLKDYENDFRPPVIQNTENQTDTDP